MIRFVFMARRKKGMSQEEFTEYWRDEHGPLVAYHQARVGLIRYVQTHRAADPDGETASAAGREARGGMEPPYDGVAEGWFKSEDAMITAMSSEAGVRAGAEIVADERKFLDLENSPFWFAHEYPQVSTMHGRPVAAPKTGIVKAHFPLRQLPHLSVAEAQRYWLTVHAPLVRSHAAARGMLCYQQVHRYDSPLIENMRKDRGTRAEPYIGHAEGWVDRLVPRAGPEVNDAAGQALKDEANFIDWSRSTFQLGKELVFIDRNWL